MKTLLLCINSLLHFLIDAVCLATIFSIGHDFMFLIPLYNTLAFSTQCLIGLLIDRNGKLKICILISCLIVFTGALAPCFDVIRICLIGIGNSIFHVSAGSIALINSDSKLKGLGMFVAPGALGVFIGTNFSNLCIIMAFILFVVSILFFIIGREGSIKLSVESQGFGCLDIKVIILLTLAIMIRAFGGCFVNYSWNNNLTMAALISFFVFSGKFFGGIICDKFGIKLTAYVTVALSALFIILGNDHVVSSLLGQFMLNISMPITLWLLYKFMCDTPSLAFGLAASALWPGTILGQYILLDYDWMYIVEFICFAISLFAITYSYNKLRGHQNEKSS